jgi:hypothetical protein
MDSTPSERALELAIQRSALDLVDKDYQRRGEQTLFDQLCVFLRTNNPPVDYVELSSRLAMTETAAQSALNQFQILTRKFLIVQRRRILAWNPDLEGELRDFRRLFKNSNAKLAVPTQPSEEMRFATNRSPETKLRKVSALIIMRLAMDRVKETYQTEEDRTVLDRLCAFLLRSDFPLDFFELGEELGKTEANAKRATTRFHEYYREFLVQEYCRILRADADTEEALQDLRRLFSA